MFGFFKGKKELQNRIIELENINKESEERCRYYQERYSNIKTEYINMVEQKGNYNTLLMDVFSRLEEKVNLIYKEITVKHKDNENLMETKKISEAIEEIENEIEKILQKEVY